MAGDNFGQGWLKSKLVQLVAIYWGTIILLVEFGKYLEANGKMLMLGLIVLMLAVVVPVSVGLVVRLFLRGRRW